MTIVSYNDYGVTLSKAIGIFDLLVGDSDTDSNDDTFQGSKTDEVYFMVGASI
jgi:hypothetical protein